MVGQEGAPWPMMSTLSEQAKVAIRSAYAHGGIKAARETAQTLVGPVGYLSVMVAALRDQETNHDA